MHSKPFGRPRSSLYGNLREFFNRGDGENIFKPKKWQRFDFNPLENQIPISKLAFSGNYAIIVDGVLNYIGKSGNIGVRLYEHYLAIGFSEKSKMKIAIRMESDDERHEIEARFIKRLRPKANKRIFHFPF